MNIAFQRLSDLVSCVFELTAAPGKKRLRGRGKPRFSLSIAPSYSRRKSPRLCRLGHDAIKEIVETAGEIGEHDVEAVTGLGEEPFFHLVGDHAGSVRAQRISPDAGHDLKRERASRAQFQLSLSQCKLKVRMSSQRCVVAALTFIKEPGLLSHDATTGHRFAVTRWRSGWDSNPRATFAAAGLVHWCARGAADHPAR